VREQAQASINLFTAQESGPGWVTFAIILCGWALATQGQAKEGIAQVLEGLNTLEIGGVMLWRPFFLGLLAEAYKEGLQVEEGLAALNEALATASRTGQHWYDAELWRLKGQLTLQQFQVPSSKSQVQKNQKAKGKEQKAKISNTQHPVPYTRPKVAREAEECFLKAIELARRQQAKSFELRAVMSLTRLWRQQGKGNEARQRLAEIYNWFTEGFDTTDLQEAKTLLKELS